MNQTEIEAYCVNTHHMFFIDYPWESKGDYIDTIKHYFPVGIVGYETSESGYKHLQCFCIGPKIKYQSLIEKWKKDYETKTGKIPTGQATKGVRRQYGKVKELKKQPMYAIAYSMKDKQYISWGIEPHVLEVAKGMSYKPQNWRSDLDKFYKYAELEREVYYTEGKAEYVSKLIGYHYELKGTLPTRELLTKTLYVVKIYTEMDLYNKLYQFI